MSALITPGQIAIGLVVLLMIVAFVEYYRPLGKLLLILAKPKLVDIKAKALKAKSPFEQTSSSLWVAESQNAYALKDIRPRAPHHYLVIPKNRVYSVLEAEPELLSEMLELCRAVARQAGIAEDGFRIVINTNPQGMQTVYHLHMHILGGRQLGLSLG